MLGQTISHYKIIDKIGEGGMGIVYKAQDTKLDRFVALKFLPRNITARSEDRQRFVIEAKAAAALNHPNIAIVHAIEESGDETFIAMEYVEGRELKEIIAQGPMPIGQITAMAVQIAEGLQAAHRKGIVHRDIKSSNIMLTDDGKVKIMDFGLAKVRGNVQVTKAGTTLGTVAYMSPEQARGEDVDLRSDLWSFGVVLYEMITGRMPFRGEHESAMMYSIMNESPGPIGPLRADTPPALIQIVNKALAKDLSSRYPSADEIIAELTAMSKGRSPVDTAPRTLKTMIRRPAFYVPLIIFVVGLSFMTYWIIDRNTKMRWARETILPEVERLVNESKWAAAYAMALKAEPFISGDPVFLKLWPRFTGAAPIRTSPPGGRVFVKDYFAGPEGWIYLGQTPIDSARFPLGVFRIRIEKEGYDVVDGGATLTMLRSSVIKLDLLGSIPENMVRVRGGKFALDIPGLEHLDSVAVGEYLIDKFEVTNKEFKEFMDHGGYQKREYWKYPFVKNGHTISWEEAMKDFRDATGRPGPSSWELGTYPEGKSDHPVGGISWYEAAAFAEYQGKALPTVYHWNIAAQTWAASYIIPLSNFENKGTVPVGKYTGISPSGTVDMAGNVREWCFNESSSQKAILGGGWNDQPYLFNDMYGQPAFDRSITNGLRCIRILDTAGTSRAAYGNLEKPFREFLKEKPVSDQIFKIYLSLYQYDHTSLNAKIEFSDTTAEWITQKISLDAAYGGERLITYLFIPRISMPPYQTVVFFPGSNALHTRSSASLPTGSIDFIMKSGRAVVYPIYKGTYERDSGLNSDNQSVTSQYREHVLAWAKDIRRSIDYVESRKEFDAQKISYYGLSWGGAMGAIMPAVEPRFKVSILYVAGMEFQHALPEVDQINFITRVKIPVIMLNGKYDHFFPVETSQKPMFELFGASADQKRYVLFETGHFVPRNQLIKESLDWLDKYLGPVKQ
jgi:serine/threonine protein kinase/formylglycine-generating enzyme required for sulfatase activity/dienelactone hydrolase